MHAASASSMMSSRGGHGGVHGGHLQANPASAILSSSTLSTLQNTTAPSAGYSRISGILEGDFRKSYNPGLSAVKAFATDDARPSSPEDLESPGGAFDFDRSTTPGLATTRPSTSHNLGQNNKFGNRLTSTDRYHTYSRTTAPSTPSLLDSHGHLPSGPSSTAPSSAILARMMQDPKVEYSSARPNQENYSPTSSPPHHSSSLNDAALKNGNGYRLPSIAELRLDLSLDEYEAHAALGSLSTAPVSRPSSATAPADYQPSRSGAHRRRDSWGSPSTSSNASFTTGSKYQNYNSAHSLVPPPPYHAYNPNYQNGSEPPSMTGSSIDTSSVTDSPDYTNQYRFRIASSASTSPSLDRPASRSFSQQQQQYPYSRSSHSRHMSSSRPSTSATSTSYPMSTPQHTPAVFPFIPAQPPRSTPETSEGEPRRKRRKYEEIERRYVCGWNGCLKAYGTLNHLNDHVSLQGHGPKRRSSVFLTGASMIGA
ncbi:hypothetical protein CPB86DRAFT_11793 [Serendipita vermifera]|nr:hypothetical protein CPB86DRAFT_11793 [Serendipita vermifera]